MNKKSVKVLFGICLLIYIGSLIYKPLDKQEDTRIFNEEIYKAFAEEKSGVQVLGKGQVKLMLPEDVSQPDHQRIVVHLNEEHILLLTHNTAIAPRVVTAPGEYITFYGQYEWNDKGGYVHITNHDPKGVHETGWIDARSRRYQ